jgi:hypothetical protein
LDISNFKMFPIQSVTVRISVSFHF